MAKNLIYLLILLPALTEYLEMGRFPNTIRDVITDIVMTFVTATIVIVLRRRDRFIENLVRCDPLTGIGNRRKFDLDIKQEVLRARRIKRCVGLIFFDLDGFKEINDKLGSMQPKAKVDSREVMNQVYDSYDKNKYKQAWRYLTKEQKVIKIKEYDSDMESNEIDESLGKKVKYDAQNESIISIT